MVKVKVTIEQVPIENFTKEELDFFFENELARSLCGKIHSYTEKKSEDKE